MLTADLIKKLETYKFPNQQTKTLASYLARRLIEYSEPNILEREFVYFTFISLLEWDDFSKGTDEKDLYDRYLLAHSWEGISLKFLLEFQMAIFKKTIVSELEKVCERVGFDIHTAAAQIETIFLASEIIVTQTTLLFHGSIFAKYILPWANKASDGEILTGNFELTRIQVVKRRSSVLCNFTRQGKYISMEIPILRMTNVSNIILGTDFEHLDEFIFMIRSLMRNFKWSSLQSSKN